jgi:hypothetical protein
MDIFIGREPHDLMLLDRTYRKLHGQGLASVVEDVSGSSRLRMALQIVTEGRQQEFPGPYNTPNMELVFRDVDLLIEIYEAGLPDDAALLSIILRRSPRHLQQVARHYELKQGCDMAQHFEKNAMFHRDTRAIVVHALLSATNPAYRDSILLEEAIQKRDRNLLAVRMTRMHWYPEHWSLVKRSFQAQQGGGRLIDTVNCYNGLFRDLMVTMAQVPVVPGHF